MRPAVVVLCASTLLPAALPASAQPNDSSASGSSYTLADFTSDLDMLGFVRVKGGGFERPLHLSWKDYAGSKVGTTISFGLDFDEDRSLIPWMDVSNAAEDWLLIREPAFIIDSLVIRLPAGNPETDMIAGIPMEWATLRIDEYHFHRIADSRTIRIRISGARGNLEFPLGECLILQAAMRQWVASVFPLAHRYTRGR